MASLRKSTDLKTSGRNRAQPSERAQPTTLKLPVPDGDSLSAPEKPGARNGRQRSAKKASSRPRRPWRTRKPNAMLIPFAVLCVLALLFVVWETALRRLLPSLSIGWHHALLTLWAGVVTAFTCIGVYLLMRRQQQKLSRTAERLTRLLESYKTTSSVADRFENPNLVHCRDVLQCDRRECPMYNSPGERCWQVVALNGAAHDGRAPKVQIQHCHERCEVYRIACPDALTELGEAFNNLTFLLEGEARQVGRMQAQMVEKEKMVAIGQMASGIAHEIGNPLSSISSIVQMVKRVGTHADVRKQLVLIESHIQRISSTVRQLGSLARPGVDRWELADLGQVMLDALELIAFDRRAKNTNIKFDPPSYLPTSYALRGQLQQVFINLAINALDAMPDGGTLTVNMHTNRGEFVVRMRDTGCGIAPAAGRRIFEPFFTTKEPGQGTGLGLSVSYGIIQKHGGKVDFASRLGVGTTFTIRIPIWKKLPDKEPWTNTRSS